MVRASKSASAGWVSHTFRSLSPRSRRAFCSGLGVFVGFSDDHCGLSANFSVSELTELRLVPGVGVCRDLPSLGLLLAWLPEPSRECPTEGDWLAGGLGPSEDLTLREAGGTAAPCCFLDDLKRNDMGRGRLERREERLYESRGRGLARDIRRRRRKER